MDYQNIYKGQLVSQCMETEEYKTPDHYDYLYEQWKDDQMIAKFDKEFGI